MKYFLLTCLLILPVLSMASADLTGRVEIDSEVIPPGTLGRAVITVINNGPDPLMIATSGTTYRAAVGFRTIGVFAGPDTPPCIVRYSDFTLPPPQGSRVVVTISPFRELLPQESFRCVVYLETYPESPDVQRIRFSFSPSEDDPIPDNNEAFVTIRKSAEIVQAPTYSGLSLALLAVSILGFGVSASNKQRSS
jgi:hypothetical protein